MDDNVGTCYPGENLHRLDSRASSVHAPPRSCLPACVKGARERTSPQTARHTSAGKREIRTGRGVASGLRRRPFTGTFHAGGQTQTQRGTDRGSTAIQTVQIFPWIASADNVHILVLICEKL
ncbi:hypothetical protein SUGI_0843250 [Cryptomeria japonica]|nr:hypothetical protein SUGI_0843250 [Cryptomeria japonica]